MKPNKKETMLLNDLKSAEEFCIEKYDKFASMANDKELSNLFTSIKEDEQQHLDSVNQLLKGKVPDMNASSSTGEDKQEKTSKEKKPCYSEGTNSQKKMQDAFLCNDALSGEKHISSSYNTSIFEFVSTPVRDVLNHIQKEEQEHGKKIYDYMSKNSMY